MNRRSPKIVFLYGLLSGVMVFVIVGIVWNLIGDFFASDEAVRSQMNFHRLECAEIVSRVQRRLEMDREIVPDVETIVQADRTWRSLRDSSVLRANYVFTLPEARAALNRGERNIPIVFDKLDRYKGRNGAWVGFVLPEEVRWFSAPDYAELLSRLRNESEVNEPRSRSVEQ